MQISAQQAAVLLGVSPRKVYGLAAPGGPIPCYRIGRNVNFDETDILEYKQQCRSVVTSRFVRNPCRCRKLLICIGFGECVGCIL